MDWTPYVPYLRIALAALLGGIVGLEREHVGKAAGTRTYSLVALGSALFTIMSTDGFNNFGGTIDPSRLAGQVVVGIGFLGAGVIMHQGVRVRGLTTAAALWVVAAIGITVGLGFYQLATFTTLFTFLILAILSRFMKLE